LGKRLTNLDQSTSAGWATFYASLLSQNYTMQSGYCIVSSQNWYLEQSTATTLLCLGAMNREQLPMTTAITNPWSKHWLHDPLN
jgi:hypothetical protein